MKNIHIVLGNESKIQDNELYNQLVQKVHAWDCQDIREPGRKKSALILDEYKNTSRSKLKRTGDSLGNMFKKLKISSKANNLNDHNIESSSNSISTVVAEEVDNEFQMVGVQNLQSEFDHGNEPKGSLLKKLFQKNKNKNKNKNLKSRNIDMRFSANTEKSTSTFHDIFPPISTRKFLVIKVEDIEFKNFKKGIEAICCIGTERQNIIMNLPRKLKKSHRLSRLNPNESIDNDTIEDFKGIVVVEYDYTIGFKIEVKTRAKTEAVEHLFPQQEKSKKL
ncbi:hypothetical protein AX774_g6689, partial [Zancudomyces culisetae]